MLHFLGASNQHSVTLSRAVRAPRCTQGKRKLMKGPAPSRHYAAESDGDANPSGLDSSISESSHSYPGLSKKNVEKQAVFPPPPWVSQQLPYQDTKLGQAGVVSWRDSALLRAAKAGRCVVVDEADKAPLEAIAFAGNWSFPKWYSMT